LDRSLPVKLLKIYFAGVIRTAVAGRAVQIGGTPSPCSAMIQKR
jgi:hypothetical protein